MEEARVSVILPAHNAGHFVGDAIESILSQTVRPLEIILVDDGSTDDTSSVAARYGDRLHVLRQPNRGVSAARNVGITAAEGELIAFIDADDQWEPRKIEVQAAALHGHPRAVVSFVGTLRFGPGADCPSVVAPISSDDLLESLLLHSTVLGPTSVALVRRGALESVGLFDPSLAQGEDWDLWIRLALEGPFVLTPEPLVRYRVHAANASRDVARAEPDNRRVLDKAFADPRIAGRYARVRSQAYANHYLRASGSFLAAGDLGRSLACLARATRWRPLALLRAVGLPFRIVRRRLAAARTRR